LASVNIFGLDSTTAGVVLFVSDGETSRLDEVQCSTASVGWRSWCTWRRELCGHEATSTALISTRSLISEPTSHKPYSSYTFVDSILPEPVSAIFPSRSGWIWWPHFTHFHVLSSEYSCWQWNLSVDSFIMILAMILIEAWRAFHAYDKRMLTDS
jgi:hypothetical protein